MQIEFDEFKYELLDLCDIKGWKVPRDSAIESLYDDFPTDPLTKQTTIDADDFQEAVRDVRQSEYRGDPGALLKAYKTVRRTKLKEIAESAPLPAPAKHEGRPCTEFVRVCRQMRAMREGRLPKFRQSCPHQPNGRPACEGTAQRLDHGNYEPCRCLAEWNARPLTDEDWALGRKTEPAAAVAQGFGMATPPARDPKEGDLVYGGVS